MRNLVLETIKERRSVRAYTNEAITEEEIQNLKNAAIQSPSAMNAQPWQFIFVRNQELISELELATVDYFKAIGEDAVVERIASRGNKVFYNAPLVVFIPCKAGAYSPVDCGIAAENLALAAKSMGLDSVIVGMVAYVFQSEKGAYWAEKLQFPEGYQFCISVAIGHAEEPNGSAHEADPTKITVID